MTAIFKHIMLMVKDIPTTVKFYQEGLGLDVKVSTPGWAELKAGDTTIALHGANENGQTANAPILSFHVDDVYKSIEKLESLGANLEGRVREPSFGKVAAMRSPDGTLISLLEPNQSSAEEK